MKASIYDKVSSVTDDYIINVNSPIEGTKGITVGDFKGVVGSSELPQTLDGYFDWIDQFATAEMRRNLYRGKNLGTAITDAQKVSIQDGSFKGMFIGDYWEARMSGLNSGTFHITIADMNYWPSTKNHLVLTLNRCYPLSTFAWTTQSDVKDAADGYSRSTINPPNLTKYAQDLLDMIGGKNNLFSISRYFLSGFDVDENNTYVKRALVYQTTYVMEPTCVMLFGQPPSMITPYPATSNTNPLYTNETGKLKEPGQLSLYRLNPQAIVGDDKKAFWLSEILTLDKVGYIDSNGLFNDFDLEYNTEKKSLRPVFWIG